MLPFLLKTKNSRLIQKTCELLLLELEGPEIVLSFKNTFYFKF